MLHMYVGDMNMRTLQCCGPTDRVAVERELEQLIDDAVDGVGCIGDISGDDDRRVIIKDSVHDVPIDNDEHDGDVHDDARATEAGSRLENTDTSISSLSEADQATFWKNVETARGPQFSDKEKVFLIKAMRVEQRDPTATLRKPILQLLINKGVAEGHLLQGGETDLELFEKVRHYLRYFVKLATSG